MALLICGDVLVCRCCEVAQYSAGVAQSRSRGEATCGGELWRLGEATESRRFGVTVARNSGIASEFATCSLFRLLANRLPHMFSLAQPSVQTGLRSVHGMGVGEI